MAEVLVMGRGSRQPPGTVYNRIVRVGRRLPMLIGLAWLLPLACGSEKTQPAPPPLATNTARPPEPEGGATAPDAFVLTPTETSSTYEGTLATTATVPFGGSGYCQYEMTLKDVAIQIEFLASGDVGQAIVRDLAVEKTVASCPYPPMDPAIQDFTVKSSAVTTTGTRVEFTGAKSNRPDTSLVVDLVQVGAGYEATATWKRVDQQPPLAWTVTGKVTLTRKL